MAVALLATLYSSHALLSPQILSLPVFVSPLAWVIGMYVMMVNGRTLGLLYREREEELGWI